VVPYNRDICIKYDAHINFERVAIRSMVKYLYKHVHKGYGHATIVIEGNTAYHHSKQPRQDRERNEIQEY